ncbi:MAG: alpha/beta hydrolase fold protein [Chlorobi bacterium]|nr:alpha/beta hydrolase fold protein [Chlorobiota bacterium]
MDIPARYCHESIIDANGIGIFTRRQGTGIPVVLCHGGPGACDNLAMIAGMIDDIATVHRYDQRGCGRSERRPPYDVATHVADLDALRERMGVERWIVGGHSWGCSLALAYAAAHPERASGLLLIGTSGLEPHGGEQYRRNYESRMTAEELSRFHDLRRRRDSASAMEQAGIRDEMLAIKLRTDMADPANFPAPEYECPMNYEVNAAGNADWERLAVDGEMRRAVASLPLPALIVHGDRDPRPSSGAIGLADMLAGSEYRSIPDAGHYPWLERPDLLAGAIRPFILRVTCSRSAPSIHR